MSVKFEVGLADAPGYSVIVQLYASPDSLHATLCNRSGKRLMSATERVAGCSVSVSSGDARATTFDLWVGAARFALTEAGARRVIAAFGIRGVDEETESPWPPGDPAAARAAS